MPRPISAIISKKALSDNLDVIRQKVGKQFLWAVVKADAYGHGLIPLLPIFKEKCDGLALLDIEDAENCRKAGWEKPILLIEGFFTPYDVIRLNELNLETIVHNAEQIQMLKEGDLGRTVKVHVKCNSGMNRLGFNVQEIPSVIEALHKIPFVEVVDVVSHFANSELSCFNKKEVPVAQQLENIYSLDSENTQYCLSNSGAILWHPEVKASASRAGIAMYGISPDSSISSESLNLKPVMTFHAQIIAIRDVKAGDYIGYGSRYKAEKKTRIGIVACGYADGYPRSVSSGAWVGVLGKKCPLTGAVSMDMLAIDLTAVPEAEIGTPVELWGHFPNVNEVASFAGTIGYELLTNVMPRVKRLYK